MTDDVVAELDAELALIEQLPYRVPIHLLAKRARDEIVALRGYRAECERQFQAKVAEIGGLLDRAHQARDEALEEAAQGCDRLATDYTIPVSADKWSDGCRGCAGRIRALKDKA